MRIAILSSYTTDILCDKLKFLSLTEFGEIEIYTNLFNQYIQDLLSSKSKLYLYKPEIVFFLFDDETWLSAQKQLFKLIGLAKKRLPQAVFLVGNIVQSYSLLLPSLQWNQKNSLAEQILSLNMKVAKLHQTHKQLYIVDINDLVQHYGRSTMIDYRMQYLTKSPWSDKGIEILSLRLIQQIKTIQGNRKKVIVLDLDNTLWGGILGEDGMENLLLSNDGIGKAYYDFQKGLLKLYESGILLVICSKNDENLVFETIKSHPYMLIKKNHLAAWRINWNNKADNLESIAKELNLGLDSFVFLDDSPYERKLLKFTYPQLQVPDLPADPSQYSEFLAGISSLDTITVTQEDKNRNEMYQHERIRSEKRLSSDSLEKFLNSLHINVSIQRATSFMIPRIAQLTQKTNQFNLTTKRYSSTQIKQFASNKEMLVLAVSSKDIIGDMGLIGVIIAKIVDKSLIIDTFLMSCRVLGRGIEEAALFSLIEYGGRFGATSIIGEFIPTKKNQMAKDFLSNSYFTSQKDGLFVYQLSKKEIKKPSWIKLNYE